MSELAIDQQRSALQKQFSGRLGLRLKRGLAVAVVLLALQQLGQGIWIMAKAYLAQFLIAQSWQQSLSDQRLSRPWPWADTWPVARLQWREQNIDLYVLDGAQGSSLAFGPGHLQQTSLPGDGSPLGSIISGHRDTHFKFLSKIKIGDRIKIQTMDSRWHNYSITASRIDNIQHSTLIANQSLQLVTCYPFNTLGAGGDLRYVVSATQIPDPLLSGSIYVAKKRGS